MVEATLYLKGITLRARDASPQMLHSLNLVVDELARQVKRHRDKRRRRREARGARTRALTVSDPRDRLADSGLPAIRDGPDRLYRDTPSGATLRACPSWIAR